MSTAYTLVQHTGYSVSGKHAFKHAVETRGLATHREQRVVESVGGKIYPNYQQARDAEKSFNFPPTNDTRIPSARGRFTRTKGFGEPIFLPAQ